MPRWCFGASLTKPPPEPGSCTTPVSSATSPPTLRRPRRQVHRVRRAHWSHRQKTVVASLWASPTKHRVQEHRWPSNHMRRRARCRLQISSPPRRPLTNSGPFPASDPRRLPGPRARPDSRAARFLNRFLHVVAAKRTPLLVVLAAALKRIRGGIQDGTRPALEPSTRGAPASRHRRGRITE